jgi:hypothetical protein
MFNWYEKEFLIEGSEIWERMFEGKKKTRNTTKNV